MKVLQINAVYGSLSTGTIMKNIQESCAVNGIDAYVAFPKGLGPVDEFSYEIGSKMDHYFHALLSRIAGKQAYYSSIATLRLIRYVKRLKPDIVHLHNLHSNYINLNMFLKYMAKVDMITVITMHDCWYYTGGCFHYTSVGCQKWQKSCGHCVKKNMDSKAYLWDASASILKDRAKYLNSINRLTLVGCSDWISRECGKSILKNKDIRTIRNGIDVNIYKPCGSDLRKRMGLEDKFIVLGPYRKWFSNINKNVYDYFVENMPEDMVLLIFGCKEVDIDIPQNVVQICFTNNPQEMAQLYSMADVMVNCSREDTLSSINLECQACGTPVVTYDATGSKETVDGKCGFAIETGNVKALFEQTLAIKRIGKSHFSKENIAWIHDNFRKEESFDNYIRLYNELYLEKQHK